MQSFGHVLDSLPRDWPAPAAEAAAALAWRLSAGELLAARVTVASWRDGVLTLVADDTEAAAQVRLLREELLEGLRRRLGAKAIHRLQVHVGAGRSPA